MTATEPHRQFATEIVQTLREHGYEAYFAGGCVRDLLLGIAPKDFDVATSARPEEVRRLFGAKRTLAVGAAFGVIVVVGRREQGQVEVATFRSDADYADGRRPTAVRYTTAREDVLRRDFTINGMLYDPIDERVLDFVGGQEDLKRGVMRAIGDPAARFGEDKLRMLRAVRFAARFGFQLDETTEAAIHAEAAAIAIVSAERITQEFRAMLVHTSRRRAMELCEQTGLLQVVLPELAKVVENKALWEHTLDVLARLREPAFPLALATLLHEIGSGEKEKVGSAHPTLEQVGQRWRLSNKELDSLIWLVENHKALRSARSASWPRVQRMLITPGIFELLDLHEADLLSLGLPTDDVAWCRGQLRRPPAELDPPPLITGDDLAAHGIPPGKIYQRLLEAVRDAQLEKRICTRAEALALADRLRT
ncbi:MAG: CCA tRNA nucleotidyltransferase [Planctomycetia bacterium]|nr:CCA tRNA nucleotidyltransferase [Planctomycetia bacterium]